MLTLKNHFRVNSFIVKLWVKRCVFGILSRLLFLTRKYFICSFILNLLCQDCLDFSLALHDKLKTLVRKFVTAESVTKCRWNITERLIFPITIAGERLVHSSVLMTVIRTSSKFIWSHTFSWIITNRIK